MKKKCCNRGQYPIFDDEEYGDTTIATPKGFARCHCWKGRLRNWIEDLYWRWKARGHDYDLDEIRW